MILQVAKFTLYFKVFYTVYWYADQQIDGKWHRYPPFSYWWLPHPDTYLPVEQLVRNEGLNIETHWVTTSDGYINKVYRVNSRPLAEGESRPAVVLLHGLVDSSDSWVVNGRNKSIGFVLADEGYDVWMTNNRGNKHSQNHTTLDAETDVLYWDHANVIEMAKYDVPAFIDFAKKHSKVDKVSVIGHSQGTQELFYLSAKNGSYVSENINFMVHLAPFVSFKEYTIINEMNVRGMTLLEPMFKKLGMFKLMEPRSLFVDVIINFGCLYVTPACNFVMTFVAAPQEFND